MAQRRNILSHAVEVLRQSGLVGEERAVKLVYLAVTSRLLNRIVSVAVKGPSSGGKSFLVEKVLTLFPSDAIHVFTAMSEHALAYGEESLVHKIIVVYETVGLAGDFGTYLIRSLLSEGRICYQTVEKTKDGIRPRRIEREGPTGLIVTTTKARLHPENETRMLSITVSDTADQTRAILRAQAQGQARIRSVDLAPWHALQQFIALSHSGVTIPYARVLAEMIPAVAVRLRRDFPCILALIEAHALLHRANREASGDAVIATLEDYAAVRELVADLVSEGIEASVSDATRDTIAAVATLASEAANGVSVTAVAGKLKLDKSAASRRVQEAITRGFIRNEEDRKGHPARLTIGDPLPEETEVLPSPCRLKAEVLHSCAVADGGSIAPSPTVTDEEVAAWTL